MGIVLIAIFILTTFAILIYVYSNTGPSIAVSPIEGEAPLTVTITSRGLTEILGTIVLYFGDGSSTLFCWGYCWDHSVTHPYSQPGSYRIMMLESYSDSDGEHKVPMASATVVVNK
jgi:hypothetical protein